MITGNTGEQFAELYTRMNAANLPGLRVEAATSLIGTIDSATRSGGGGEMASAALNYRAFAKYGITDPLKQQRRMERGMFADLGDRNHTTLFQADQEELQREFGPMGEDWLDAATGRQWNLTKDQAHSSRKLPAVDMNRTSAFLRKIDKRPENMSFDGLAELTKLLSGNGSSLDAMKIDILGRQNYLTDPERADITAASGDQLRELLGRAIANHGMKTTPGSDMAQASANMTNQLTATFRDLVPATTDLKNGFTALLKSVQDAARAFQQPPPPSLWWSPDGTPNYSGQRPQASYQGGFADSLLQLAAMPMMSGGGQGGISIASFGGGRGSLPAIPTPGALGSLFDLIGLTEGTGGNYNDTFAHDRYSGHHDLSSMTLDEIDAMQSQMLANGGQSPVGRFQINQGTLRDLRSTLRLTGQERLTPELQRRLAAKLYGRSGGTAAGQKASVTTDVRSAL